MRRAGLTIDNIDQDLAVLRRLFDHRKIADDSDRIGAQIAIHGFDQIDTRLLFSERDHAAVVFVFELRQRLAPVFHFLIGIEQRHARIVGYVERGAARFSLFAELLIESLAVLLQQMRADVISDGGEQRNL